MRTNGWEHAASTALRIQDKKKLPSFTLISLFYFLFVYSKKKDVAMKATQVELQQQLRGRGWEQDLKVQISLISVDGLLVPSRGLGYQTTKLLMLPLL